MIRDPPTVLQQSLAPPLNTLGPSGFPVLLTHSLPDSVQGKVPALCQALLLKQGVPHSCCGGSGTSPMVATKTAVLVTGKARFSVILLLSLALSFNNSSEPLREG